MACGCLAKADDWWWQRVDLRRVYISRWGRTNSTCATEILTGWRTVVFIWLFGTAISNWTVSSAPNRFLGFLTYWSMFAAIFAFFFSACSGFLALYNRFRRGHTEIAVAKRYSGRTCLEQLNVHVARAAHALTTIAVPVELLVTLLYWGLLYNGQDVTPELIYRDTVPHAFSFATIGLDMLFGAKRFPDRHIVIALIFAVLYLATNIGVTLGTNIAIYSVLKWNSGSSAALAIGAVIAVIIFYYLAAWVSWLCDRCAGRCNPCSCCCGAEGNRNAPDLAFASPSKEIFGDVYLAALGGAVPKVVAETMTAAAPNPAKGEKLGVLFAQAAILVADPFPSQPKEGQGIYNQPFAQHGLGFYDEWVSLPTKFWCCVPKLQHPDSAAPKQSSTAAGVEMASVGGASATPAQQEKERRASQAAQLRQYRSPAIVTEASGNGNAESASASPAGVDASPGNDASPALSAV